MLRRNGTVSPRGALDEAGVSPRALSFGARRTRHESYAISRRRLTTVVNRIPYLSTSFSDSSPNRKKKNSKKRGDNFIIRSGKNDSHRDSYLP